MQRPIKFRAWDGKRILDNVTPWVDNSIIELYEDDHMVFNVDSIMQYTGLKDKNGVEIYEGDIMKLKDRFAAQVIFDSGAFTLDGSPMNMGNPNLGDMLELSIGNDIHVAGNIYENPELLEFK